MQRSEIRGWVASPTVFPAFRYRFMRATVAPYAAAVPYPRPEVLKVVSWGSRTISTYH